MPGPSWLGIGAQRSGTDWVSRLLTQHPKVDFGINGKKEQGYLKLIPDGKGTEDGYRALFPDDGILRGDWTPHNMPSMLMPRLASRVIKPEAPLFVLLRDPVERLASSMRLAKQNKRIPTDYHEPWIARAHQFGHYAAHLDGWATVFPRERFVIVTYEEAQEDIVDVCGRFWSALGVASHRLEQPRRRVKVQTEGTVEWVLPEGAREALIAHYLPGVRHLRDTWGVEVHRWRNFAEHLD